MQQEYGPYPSTFKAAVALEAIQASCPMDVLSARYSVPELLIREWTDILRNNAAWAFTQPSGHATSNTDLFDSRELATTIAENSTQGFAMMDQRGFCIFANKAWLDMTGYSADEISSSPLHYLVHHHHPDGTPYPMEDCPIDRALPENFDVRQHEDVFFRKDGSRFDVACAASPIFRGGKAVATVIEIRDVTEQKKQARERLENEQRALRLAEAAEDRRRQLDAFLDAAPVGIGLADSSGRLIVVNRANKDLWGKIAYLAENVRQYQEFKGWWADGQDHHGEPVYFDEWALARALRGEEVNNDIVDIEPFDDPETRKTISVSSRPIRDDNGKITGAVVVQVDITAQREAENALRHANLNKDNFIATLAHELRNPLAPIRASVELFQMRAPDDPLLKRATEAMARQIAHITRLVDDLLDVARIARGNVELKLEICDLNVLAMQTVEDYRPTLTASGIEIKTCVPVTPIWVRADTARLVQIFGNLLHNASKFTKAGDRVSVEIVEESNQDGRFALISIADTGIGMPKEFMPTLFGPLVQASQDLGRSLGGLGLGLALVKGLSELHGGSVGAHSAGHGLGSTFTVRLPLANPPKEDCKDTGKSGGIPSLRILAIDDNVDALEVLSMLLVASGHEVDTAYDGYTGIEAIRRVKPDLVICDIGLPGHMTGHDVAREVRSDKGLGDTMMIALSGYGQESDKNQSALAGFEAHLVKPVRFTDLEVEIRKAGIKKRMRSTERPM